TCTGFGTSGCSGSMSCTGGTTGVCCDNCPTAANVDCGEPIPSSSCRTCTGFGARCPSGTNCINPPGTTTADQRVGCGNWPHTCPAARAADGGGPIPSPGCRPCTAFGARCPSGTNCINPPGTTTADQRVCCGNCPGTGTVACGMGVPPVTDSTGAICRTCS